MVNVAHFTLFNGEIGNSGHSKVGNTAVAMKDSIQIASLLKSMNHLP